MIKIEPTYSIAMVYPVFEKYVFVKFTMTSTSEEFRNELNSGKPLFSLEVDDVLIQHLFQKFSEQLKQQSEEIAYLKAELNNRPKMEDFLNLSQAVVTLQKQCNDSSDVLSETVKKFKSSLESRQETINDYVNSKLNEMLFSVNAAIRSELEALDKTPASTQQAIDEVHEMKLKVAKMSQKLDDVKDTVIQMAAAYDGTMKIDRLKRKTVPSCVRVAATRDRNQIQQNADDIDKMKKQFEEFTTTFNRILPYADRDFPQFAKGCTYSRNEIPKFPEYPYVYSFNDFASYTAKVIPLTESILRELHSYIKQLDATLRAKLDQREYNVNQNELQKTLRALIDETTDYKNRKDDIVSKENFDELADQLYSIVNGSSNSACTNTRCMACGKFVQRTTGSPQISRTETYFGDRPKSSRRAATTLEDQFPGANMEVRAVYSSRTPQTRLPDVRHK